MSSPSCETESHTCEVESRSWQRRVFDQLFTHLISIFYRGAVEYFTISRLDRLGRAASMDDVRRALVDFQQARVIEDQYVKKAATLATITTAATLSWPAVELCFWPAKACWYSSFLLSIFALITGGQRRVLNLLPPPSVLEHMDNDQVCLLRQFILVGPKRSAQRDQGRHSSKRCLDLEGNVPCMPYAAKMLWFWQSPMMQMSWAWVHYLFGLTFFLLTPLVARAEPADLVSVASAIALVYGILAASNFFYIGSLASMDVLDLQYKIDWIPTPTPSPSACPACSTCPPSADGLLPLPTPSRKQETLRVPSGGEQSSATSVLAEHHGGQKDKEQKDEGQKDGTQRDGTQKYDTQPTHPPEHKTSRAFQTLQAFTSAAGTAGDGPGRQQAVVRRTTWSD